jgi:S1-C subfamily serine protease
MGLVSPSAFGLIHGFRPEKGLLQLSIRLSPGNTGAPVFDRRGRVVGIVIGELFNTPPDITSGIRSLNTRQSGVSLAVPINTVRRIAQEIIAEDDGQHGWLGIVGRYDLPLIETKGIVVWKVIQNSPAEKAGIRKDDIIVEYNGHPITEPEELVSQIRQMRQGIRVRLKIKRGDRHEMVTVQVGEKPPNVRRE